MSDNARLEIAFEQVVEIAADQARSSAALQELARASSMKMDSVQAVLTAQTAALNSLAQSVSTMAMSVKEGRVSAVSELKDHVSLEIAKDRTSWKVLFWLGTSIVAGSNVLAGLLTGLIEKWR